MVTLILWTYLLSCFICGRLTAEFARLEAKRAREERMLALTGYRSMAQARAAFAKMSQSMRTFGDGTEKVRHLIESVERVMFGGETASERAMREANEYRKGGLGHVHVVDARNYLPPTIGIDYDGVDW